ncbi:PTS sugar transporter subunit IIA [Bacillus chungangensis]|uniref:Mannose/fructose/sorbose-specific phosphotransferase system IIA component n=1 Tax=Bacillus chungangensis TaxID=587633 RepID=A0ABT9WR73_9BACI|nr:PTS sugar transporter subunit IIA [Bacillus chungangensis]MDQ0175594.1 mannose/fructose/sorbose-specific phosphotransferase system IIA component [Bacillus chungangensis]
MIGIVLTGHGSFAPGMLSSVELITGEMKQIQVVTFNEDQDLLQKQLEKAIAEVNTGSGVVCFTDLAGGTPFNVCAKIAAAMDDVKVIGGTNSPMLLSGFFQRESSLDEFVEKVLNEGKSNIKQFLAKKKVSETAEDGI